MSARDAIDVATDVAAGERNNQYGGVVYEGEERNLIELGLLRLTAAGYRILAPGELDRDTLEAAAKVAEKHFDLRHNDRARFASMSIAAALRAMQEKEG